jgi:RecJ-like exonuclease
MSWDWKKAMGVGEDSHQTALAAAAVTGRQPAGPKKEPRSPGIDRVASIAWRTAGVGNFGLPGVAVALLEECDHECVFCHGRGELASGSVCPVCNGRGKVHVAPPSVKCAFCGGQGQKPPRSNLTCWVCKGKGIVSVTPPVMTCPDCLGRGKKPCKTLYCDRCRGVGVVVASPTEYGR